MLSITARQMEAFEADFRRRRRLRYVAALRACGWIDAGTTEAAALQRVDAAIADAKSVGIDEEEDLVRFAALSFIPERQRHQPAFARCLGGVLLNTGASPRDRLDFIFSAFSLERHGATPLPFPPYRA